MSDKSHIEWTDASWNPVTGCSKVSQGCKNCYALRDWARLSAPRPKPNIYTGRAFTDVAWHPQRLDQPLRWRQPRKVFVNSMSDLFHEAVPFEFIDQVFAVMCLADRHQFQVLTKRPRRMLEWFRYNALGGALAGTTEARVGRACMQIASGRGEDVHHPYWDAWFSWPVRNIWLGVSVEDQATADERIPLLLETPAAVRFLSCEPLLGPIELREIELPSEYNLSPSTPGLVNCLEQGCEDRYYDVPATVDWVIAGGESGPHARPMHPEWVRSLRDQCVTAGVPFFFKQWGEWAPDPGWSHERPGAVNAPFAGARVHHWDERPYRGDVVYRVGKKTAGRELDGQTWDQYPNMLEYVP